MKNLISDTELRLFLGISLSSQWSQELGEIRHRNKHLNQTIKWVKEEDLHITLSFFGNTPVEMLPNLESLLYLSLKGSRPFSMTADTYLLAPKGEDARMLWLKCLEKQGFSKLYHKIGRQAQRIFPEIQLRKKPIPHVTIGRFKQGTIKAGQLWLPPQTPNTRLEVTELSLFQSIPEAKGPRYMAIWKFNLKNNVASELI